MTYPHGPPARPRPVLGHREQRWRWWLMRVDEERCVYRFVEDVERFDWATMFADAAVATCGGDFIIWDSEERRPAYDTRKLREKMAAVQKKQEPVSG